MDCHSSIELDAAMAEIVADLHREGYGKFLGIGFQHEGERDMPIDTSQLRALAEAGAVKQLEVFGTPEGFKVVVNGNVELYTQRGQLKFFANANSVIRTLRLAGVTRFVFDVKGIPDGN